MVSGARALRHGAVRQAISTFLTQRERGCCERGTLRGPFVFKAHALVLGSWALTRLYVLSDLRKLNRRSPSWLFFRDGASRAGFEVTIGSHAAMQLAIEPLSNAHGMTGKRGGLPPGGQQSVPG
jgi:hypothetical protein